MYVIAMAQRKGGVGKTTLAVNVAGELAHRDYTVTLIDADPQGSALEWAVPKRLGFTVRQELLTFRSVSAWIRNVLKSGTDVVIIDTPAGIDRVFEQAVVISDLLVVPCGPSTLDINAAVHTLTAARDTIRTDASATTRFLLVPTRVDLATEEGRQIVQELAELGETLGPYLSYDPAFVRAAAQRRPIWSLAPGTRADNELKAVTDCILEQLARPDEPPPAVLRRR